MFAGQDGNHALLMAMVLVCMTLGVCLGAGMAFVCHKQEFMNVPWLKDMVEVRCHVVARRNLYHNTLKRGS